MWLKWQLEHSSVESANRQMVAMAHNLRELPPSSSYEQHPPIPFETGCLRISQLYLYPRTLNISMNLVSSPPFLTLSALSANARPVCVCARVTVHCIRHEHAPSLRGKHSPTIPLTDR